MRPGRKTGPRASLAIRADIKGDVGNLLNFSPTEVGLRDRTAPWGPVVPKGPSGSHTGILPAGISAPSVQSPGNAVQPGETLPLIGRRSQGESGRGSGTWDGERRSWGAGEHGGGDVTGPRKKVPAFNAEAPAADLEGTWARPLRFPCYCCHIASLGTVIMTGQYDSGAAAASPAQSASSETSARTNTALPPAVLMPAAASPSAARDNHHAVAACPAVRTAAPGGTCQSARCSSGSRCGRECRRRCR